MTPDAAALRDYGLGGGALLIAARIAWPFVKEIMAMRRNGPNGAAQRELERERHEMLSRTAAQQTAAMRDAASAMHTMTAELKEVAAEIRLHRESAAPAIAASLETYRMVQELHSGEAPTKARRR